MKCNQCGADVPAGSAFCSRCGAQLTARSGSAPGTARMQPAAVHDLPEEELWTGGYSTRAMTGWLILAARLCNAAFVGGTFFPPIGWMVAAAFAVLLFA